MIEAADGNRFDAFAVATDRTGAPAVVIMPDVRGLHPFYEDLALRFAEAGVHATAIDYFGRTAGTGPRGADFPFMDHVQRTRPRTIAADVAAAVAHLRASTGATALFTVGFCFGGRHSFNQAGEDHGLAGVIGFYGSLREWAPGDPTTPERRAPAYRCPVLGLFGGADPSIPAEQIDGFRRALEEAGIGQDLVVYPGRPHSFFDRSFDGHAEACADAWGRVLAFISTGS